MSRPEHQGPPELYYNNAEAAKYTDNTRIIYIQHEMAERALELLCLPDDAAPKLILDLGCGSALAGSVLESRGHAWIGMDISSSMLEIARRRVSREIPTAMDLDDGNEVDSSGEGSEDEGEDQSYSDVEEGSPSVPVTDLFLHDMGSGVGFRPGTFDGCISISALQWLCHSNKSSESPKARLSRLFSSLFASLARGARAVFQFYPESPVQIDLILGCATKAGFSGGLVVDYPNSTKAKKYYLCLMTGTAASIPKGRLGVEEDEGVEVAVNARMKADWRGRLKAKKLKQKIKGKEWLLQKKELYRKRGREIAEDSKYTARKRRPKF